MFVYEKQAISHIDLSGRLGGCFLASWSEIAAFHQQSA
jgi:hypothetical protein